MQIDRTMTECAPILQDRLPHTPWAKPAMRRLPGIQPLDIADWLVVDEAYARQMALRDRLIAERPGAIHALDPAALPAARELLDAVLGQLAARGDFGVGAEGVRRPDGTCVPVDRDRPLLTVGRLVQEDFCLMEARDGVPVLTGAILCFPSNWTLAEKMGRALSGIHLPVSHYDDALAARVERLFAALRPGRALWRANAHFHHNPALFQPRSEAAARTRAEGPAPYLRSERQVLVRLPSTGAVIFSIHTYVIATESLDPAQRAALAAHPNG